MDNLQADRLAETTPVSPPTTPRWLWLVVGLGLAYGALAWLMERGAGASRLWWLDPLLLIGFAAGLWYQRHAQPRGGRRWAGFLFIALAWLTGMLYELSLRTGATGFGGMHPDTATSFLLAQGHYVPYVVGGWWLARRYGYDLPQVFLTGALAALYEITFSGAPRMLAAPNLWLLTPLVIGYYLTVYGLILAVPLLFIDPRDLWAATSRPITTWGVAWRAVGFGVLCWVLFTTWAAIVM